MYKSAKTEQQLAANLKVLFHMLKKTSIMQYWCYFIAAKQLFF